MKGIHFSAILAVLLLSLSVASASAAYDPHEPIVVVPHTQPPVLLTPSCELAQQLCLLYPDGTNVTLAQPPTMKVRACSLAPNGQCITFDVNLVNGTTPCNYAYRINATTLGLPVGDIRLYVIAGSMTDKLGHPFPSVDTAIGTVTLNAACSLPSTTTSQGNCGNVTSTSKPPPGTNCTNTITSPPTVTSTPPSLAREVQPPVESTNPNPASPPQQSQTAVNSQPELILAVLGVLVFAGAFMTLRSRKH